jgi:hypothetical protein
VHDATLLAGYVAVIVGSVCLLFGGAHGLAIAVVAVADWRTRRAELREHHEAQAAK